MRPANLNRGSQVKPEPEANPFRTLDPSGKPVQRRFSTATALRDVYNELQTSDERGEARRRETIRKMYDFFRPFDPAKMKAAGLAGLTNVNTGELAGQVDARAGAINDMALDTTDLVELRPLPAELAGPDAERIGSVVAEEFSSVLRETPEFLPAIATMVRECDLYGIGPVAWNDPYDFKPVPLQRGQVKFPDDAPSISTKCELIMVESQFPAWYLVGLLDQPETSRGMGWNTKEITRYLKDTFLGNKPTETQSQDVTGTSSVESALQLVRQNRLYESQQFKVLRVVHAYVREVSGGRNISHYIVAATGETDDFLFMKEDAYDSMDQCVIWLPYKVTEVYARAQRGLASAIVPLADIKNRIFCKMVDAAFNEASLKLEAPSAGEAVRNTVIEQGAHTFYVGGVKPISGRVAPDFAGLGSVHELIGRISSNNVTGALGPAALPERIYSGADRKTKDQVQMEAEASAKTEQAVFVMRSMIFDTLFRECFRRFMNLVLDPDRRAAFPEVERFIDRCERRMVPLELLADVPQQFAIYMCRDLVTGGAEAKAGIIMDILSTVGGNLDENGRVRATRDLIKSRAGINAADRYRPEMGRDDMPSDAASHAILENNAVMRGEQVLVGQDQLHWSHIPIHAQVMEQIREATETGQVDDAAMMLQVLQAITEHIEQHTRIGGMQIGKEQDAKDVIQGLRSFRPIAQALTMMANAQEREQEAAMEAEQRRMEELQKQAEGHEARAAMHDSDNKAAVKMYEADRMAEVALAKAQSQAQTEAFRARAKASTDRIAQQMRRVTGSSAMTQTAPPSTSGMTPTGWGQDLGGFEGGAALEGAPEGTEVPPVPGALL